MGGTRGRHRMFWLKLILMASTITVGKADSCSSWMESFNPTCVDRVDCSSTGYAIYTWEDCPVDSELFTVNKTDILDTGEKCPEIDISGNKIILRDNLDIETSKVVPCDLFTTEDYFFLSNLDVNEFFPEPVEGTSYSEVNINESEAKSNFLEISYLDRDYGEGGNLQGEFVKGVDDPSGIFDITTTHSGDQTTFTLGTKALDYETRMDYYIRINVISTDARKIQKNTTHTVLVIVMDIGDQAPMWIKFAYSQEFEEGDLGRTVFTVEARDGDLGINNPIKYSITKGNDAGFFEINEDTGEVKSAKAIDREELDETLFVLEITAQEFTEDGAPAPPPSTSTTTANVYIKDVNNKIPTFNQEFYEVTMAEITGSDRSIPIVAFIYDMDEGESGEFTITSDYPEDLEINPSESRLNTSFSLFAKGRTETIFNYEDRDYLIIQLTATEKADPSHTGKATLNITLTDQNDNKPEFIEPEYEVSVKETESKGFEIQTVEALDDDLSDDFGTDSIRYFLESCSAPDLAIDIDTMTGVITLAEDDVLDFERYPTVDCDIIAYDNNNTSPKLQGNSKIIIHVLDIVDSTPTLDDLPVGMSIDENSPTDTPLEPSITGKDADAEAIIEFQIDWDKSTAELDKIPVDINKVKGWFNIEKQDKETESNYEAIIKVGGEVPDREVADTVRLSIEIISKNKVNNTGSDRDTGILQIAIIDENDCFPEFDDPQVNPLEENAPNGTVVAIYKVTDLDLNDNVTFSINDPSLLDIIQDESNPFTAQLMVAEGAKIDREEYAKIDVVVTVQDSAGHKSPQEITVDIIDLNDNGPIMQENICGQDTQIYEISELEINSRDETHNGTLVYTFKADDKDVGEQHKNVSYILMNEQLTDTKNRRLPFKIKEAADELGNVVGNLVVFLDPLEGKTLDREGGSDDNFWEIDVRANDHCNDGEFQCKVNVGDPCKLNIKVLDVNDKPPSNFQWTPKTEDNEIIVNEFLDKDVLASIDGTDYEISARDADEPNTSNTNLTYTVTSVTVRGGTDDDFELFEAITLSREVEDKTQYYCKLKARKDFRELRGFYDIHLMAKDMGEPPLSTTKIIPLNIEDANDHTPEFSFNGCLAETGQTITMEENIGGTLGKCSIRGNAGGDDVNIEVLDDDLGLNSQFEVSIDPTFTQGGNQTGDFGFRFNKATQRCELYTTKPIDRESGNQYNISLYVEDKGDPPLFSWSWIQVLVTNQFESDPYFCLNASLCKQTITIKENDTEATSVFANAFDMDNKGVDPSDIYNYDPVYYAAVGGDTNIFKLFNNTTPVLQLKLKGILDRETKDTYSLYIDAYNEGYTPEPIPDPLERNYTLYLTIQVLDVNDNAPVFPEVVIGSFTETYQKDNPVATVYATDADLNETLDFKLGTDFTWHDGGPSPAPLLPFKIENAENNTAKLILNFDPTGVNSGYCTFTIMCTDNDGIHTGSTVVKVYAITVDYLVPVIFNNTVDTVQSHKDSIEQIFGESFGFDCTVDSIDGDSVTARANGENRVTAKMHFIDSKVDKPVKTDDIMSMASDGVISAQLKTRLQNEGLYLISLGDLDIDGGGGPGVLLMLQVLLAVVTFVLMSLIILLTIAYCVRTRKLERQVKVLSTNTFGSKSSELNRVGTEMAAIPGSNKFLGEGSNPLYNLTDEDVMRNDDSDGDSGDSVLVGIEDNPQFIGHGVAANDLGNGFENPAFSRSIDQVSGPDPFSGGMRSNPLLEMGMGSGDDIDLTDALQNYGAIVRRGSSGSEVSMGDSPYDSNFSFGK